LSRSRFAASALTASPGEKRAPSSRTYSRTPAGVALSLESDFFDGSAELIASGLNSAASAGLAAKTAAKSASFVSCQANISAPAGVNFT